MKIAAFIFARGGSKGLPRKNILPLFGKPLIAWSIEQALAVKEINEVYVSTDSSEIKDLAEKYGAKVPFIRPADLSQDDAPEWLAWKHALEWYKDFSGALPEVMVSIPTTSPLRLPVDIQKCLFEYKKYSADAVVTVCKAHRSPYFNMLKSKEDGTVNLVCPSKEKIYRRQDVPETYDLTTVCYVVNPKFVMTHNGIFDGNVRAVHIPSERAIDIDTLLDFQIAEYLMRKRHLTNKNQ